MGLLLTNYQPIEEGVWTGRIDDCEDWDSFRWHQVVKKIDLNNDDALPKPPAGRGVCFLGYCGDQGVARNKGRTGTSHGPGSIRRQMANLPCTFDRSVHLFDAGNILCRPEGRNIAFSQKELALAVAKILAMKLFPIVLGGGHEMALGNYHGIMAALSKRSKKKPNLGIVNFDAHFDLRSYEDGGNSGSMFLQIADLCKKKKNKFSYFCIGIQRTANTNRLFQTASDLKVQTIMAKDIQENNLPEASKRLLQYMKVHDHVYLSICADVFSSAFAPAVSSPQPFGMQPETALRLIKQVVAGKKVVGMDIAEVCPRFDEDDRTAKLMAIVVFAVVNTILDQG